jgi:hypothetical protein
LYPIDLRYLERHKHYKLYDWISVPIERNSKDPRPESYKVRADNIEVLGHLGTDREWAARRDTIMRDGSWHFECLEALKAKQKESRTSIGIVAVAKVLRVELTQRSDQDRKDHDRKAANIASVGELFVAKHKELAFLPWRVRLHWACVGAGCPGHTATVLDWGLNELGRRDGREKALKRMEALADPQRNDLRLYMGNLFSRQHIFSIIGLWYPKRAVQQSLL